MIWNFDNFILSLYYKNNEEGFNMFDEKFVREFIIIDDVKRLFNAAVYFESVIYDFRVFLYGV